MKIFFKLIYAFIIICFFNGDLFAADQNRNSDQKIYQASSLEWKLWGFTPQSYRSSQFIPDPKRNSETRGIPAPVPGSVQMALKNAGIIKDWNIGLNHNDCEWVENRSWMYSAKIPDEWIRGRKVVRLVCKGLDDNGVILINSREIGQFNNTHIPYTYELTAFLGDKDNTLEIVFNPPPRYLGTPYFSTKIQDWKPRFYYVWDWMPRNVQIGIWDDVFIEVADQEIVEISDLKVLTSADRMKDIGVLSVSGEMGYSAMKGRLSVTLLDDQGKIIINETVPCTQIRDGKTWNNLKIKRWWPNGDGEQNLYALSCTLFDENGTVRQVKESKVGFKNISWESNKNAPAGADPWLCVVNNKPVFLQGVNWTPIRPNFADLKESDYRTLLSTYKTLGANVFRVWGGAKIEKSWFYDLCDEFGILVWQEFPLSSSGYDNYPPETVNEIQAISVIARSYIQRLRHHASLLMWCGGNELYEFGDKAMVTDKHPMIRRLKEVVLAEDPGRRFVPASPSGINIWGGLDNFGKGVNWDTHGPWTLPFTETDKTMAAVENYWNLDDALIHSEVGVSGASSAGLINKYRGDYKALPANHSNPLWNRFNWWIEWDDFLREHNGREPLSLEEYISWSQDRQTKGLTIALRACKKRFPACGGFIIWMGHDSYPCTANTSIIDFDGNPKPAAIELSKIWKTNYVTTK
jgi:beta-mannosidase